MAGGEGDRRTAHPADYDTDLGRFLTNQAVTMSYSAVGDVHEQVAERLGGDDLTDPVLDLGGGNGRLARRLHGLGVATVVLDRAGFLRGRGLDCQSAERLAQHFATPMTVTKRGVLVWGRRR